MARHLHRSVSTSCVVSMAVIIQWTCAPGAKGNVATGPFVASDPWFSAPSGFGVVKPQRGARIINIDTSGDGSPDTEFILPSEIQPDDADSQTQQFDFEHRLSPTQDMLYVKKFGDNGSKVCGDSNFVEIYLYLTTSPPNLIPFTGAQRACIRSPLSIQPRFYDHDGDVIRTMYLVGAPNPPGTTTPQAILWADLVNGVSNLDNSTYGHGIPNFPGFAPSGNAAFVIHSNNTPFPKYTFVDLCKSRVGGISGLSSARDLGAPFVTAHVIEPSAGLFRAIIRRNSNDVPGSAEPLDVSCFKPPTLRACCLDDPDLPCIDASPGLCSSSSLCGFSDPDGNLCDNFNCAGIPRAACCFSDGTCVDILPEFCSCRPGTPDPNGDLCADVTCEDTTTQACCFPNGDCDVLLEARCTDQGGVPQPGYPACEIGLCPPPQEACCPLQGNCYVTEVNNCALNQDTSQGPGTVCIGPSATICPELVLEVSASGPLTAELAEVFDYTLSYANTGDLDGVGVTLRANLPPFIEFVSASDGGMQPPGSGTVTWDLGNLAVGGSGQVTLTVRADCSSFLEDTYFSNYYLRDSRGPSFSGLVEVVTTISEPPTGGIDVQVTSTPAAPLPLKAGDIVTHAVTITNLINQRRANLTMMEFRAGPEATLNSLIDPGSGVVDMISANRWTWSGALEPLAATTISFTTRMRDCLTVTQTALNNGEIVVTHACGDVLASAATRRLPVRPVMRLTTEVIGYPPPSRIQTALTDHLVQLVRYDELITVRFSLINSTPDVIPNASMHFRPPASFVPAVPLFVAPTDPAAVYNELSRLISWNGSLAPNQSVEITIRGCLANLGGCMTGWGWNFSDGTCFYTTDLRFAGLPVPPTEPHLVVVSELGYVWTYRPGVDTDLQQLFCAQGEYVTGLAVAANGDIWLSGLPTLRFNPWTLAIEGFPRSFSEDLDVPYTTDVAYDPGDDTVVFVGSTVGDKDSYATARRYDPATGTITPVFDDTRPKPTLRSFERSLVDREGRLVAVAGFTIARINPANPSGFQILGNPDYHGPSSLTLDTDGDYLSSFSSTAFGGSALVKIDRGTGAFSGILGLSRTFDGSAVADNGDVFLASSSAGLVVARGGGTQVLVTPPFIPRFGAFGVDMEWVVPSTVPGDANGDGLVNLRDFLDFTRCFSLATSSSPECLCADFNANGTIDLADLPDLAENLGRATAAGLPGCRATCP